MKAYESDDGSKVAGYSYYDRSGQGSWDLIILVEWPSAIEVTPVQMIISPTSYNVRFSPSTPSPNLLNPDDVIVSQIFSPASILAVGCESCEGGRGKVFFYDVSSNLNLTYTLEPEENVNTFTKIGSNMIYRSNTGFSEQFWYTSLKWGTTRVLNSITFFKESRSDFW